MSKEEIASKLRTAREKAGYKQEDIAIFWALHRKKSVALRHGRTRVDVDTLVTLCNAIQCGRQ
mgnify:CR=1 FL=1